MLFKLWLKLNDAVTDHWYADEILTHTVRSSIKRLLTCAVNSNMTQQESELLMDLLTVLKMDNGLMFLLIKNLTAV